MQCLDKSRLIDVDEVVATKFKGRKVPRILIAFIKKYIRQDYMNSIIARSGDGVEFCGQVLKEFNIDIEVSGLENIPADGSLYTFASNHPLGGIDGLALASIIGENFGDVKMLVNDFLMFIKPIAPMCTPINKMGGQGRNLPRLIDEAFRSDKQMLVFPAGKCSRRIDGKIQDVPWSKSFITKSVETGRAIVPVHFTGRNSRMFYWVANICKKLKIKTNIAMFMLPSEMFRARNSHFRIIFGKPIPYDTFNPSRTATEWAAEIRQHVYNL